MKARSEDVMMGGMRAELVVEQSFRTGSMMSLSEAFCSTLRVSFPPVSMLGIALVLFFPHAKLHGVPLESDFGAAHAPLMSSFYPEESSFLVQALSHIPCVIGVTFFLVFMVPSMHILQDQLFVDFIHLVRWSAFPIFTFVLLLTTLLTNYLLAQHFDVVPVPFSYVLSLTVNPLPAIPFYVLLVLKKGTTDEENKLVKIGIMRVLPMIVWMMLGICNMVVNVVIFATVFTLLGKTDVKWLQIIIAFLYPLFRIAARQLASWSLMGPSRFIDRLAEKKHVKDPNFPLPNAAKFYDSISFVELLVVPLCDAITTMGIQVVLTETSVLITVIFALGDAMMCGLATRKILKVMDASGLSIEDRKNRNYGIHSRPIILAAYRVALEEHVEVFTAFLWFAIFSGMQVTSVQFFGFPIADFPAYATNALIVNAIEITQYMLFRRLLLQKTHVDFFRVHASVHCHSCYKRVFGPFIMIGVWFYLYSRMVAFGVDVTFKFDWISGAAS